MEDIREGLDRLLSGCGMNDYTQNLVGDQIFEYLHSQGVVKKVERDKPDWLKDADSNYISGYIDCMRDRPATEPLI